jgi:NAD(P)-dependent dehydrogenase (short-subunit alcohol dehydrogenase family)
MPDLSGRRILVTGAAQGLGRAIARHCAGQGARLLLMDRDAEGLHATLAACPGAKGAQVDLSDAAATARAIADLVTAPVDALIHNAAILKVEPIDTVTLATFQATMNVGLQAGFQLTQALWPGMAARGGTLIFVSSRSGIEGFHSETAYCAAKHALEGLSKCLAMEGAPHGIASHTITPGMAMHTPMSETNYPPELRAKWVDPIRLAPAFAWLSATPRMALSGQRLNAWDLSQEHPS